MWLRSRQFFIDFLAARLPGSGDQRIPTVQSEQRMQRVAQSRRVALCVARHRANRRGREAIQFRAQM
jgi:hypothetical protein